MNAEEDQSFSSRMESLQTEKRGQQKACCSTYVFGVNHALHLAAEDGDIGKVRYLVKNGADVNEKNESGETPLLWAARAGHVDVVKHLLINGADVYVKNESGTTALHWAARAGHVEVVKCLVEKNAEVNARKSEITPLHWAAWAGHIDVAKYLVENGAEVDAKRKSGVTALHLAYKQGHVDLVRCLVENGARVEAENEDEEVIAGETQPVNNTKKPVENEEALVLDEVLTLQDKLRDAMSEIEKLKKANSEKQAENMTLKDENTKLYAEIMQVRSENLCNSIKMFNIKLGGKVHANDDEDVGVGEGESYKQSYVQAQERGCAVTLDHPEAENRSFFECLATHLGLKTEDIINMVFSFMCANQCVLKNSEDGKEIKVDLLKTNFPDMEKQPTWDAIVATLLNQMAHVDVVIQCSASLFSLNINIYKTDEAPTLIQPFLQNATNAVSLAYTGGHYMLLGNREELASCGKSIGKHLHVAPIIKNESGDTDLRHQCLVQALENEVTLYFDPSGARNRCFYDCLAEHLKLATRVVISKVFAFMSENQFVRTKYKDGKEISHDLFNYLSDSDFPNLGKRPKSWNDAVEALFNQMATHVVIRCAASLFSLNITVIKSTGAPTLIQPFLQNATNAVSLAYTGCHYMLLGKLKKLPICGKDQVEPIIKNESGDGREGPVRFKEPWPSSNRNFTIFAENEKLQGSVVDKRCTTNSTLRNVKTTKLEDDYNVCANNSAEDGENSNQIKNEVLVQYSARKGTAKYYVPLKAKEAGEYLEEKTKKTFIEDQKQLLEASLRNMVYGANVNTCEIVKKPGHSVIVKGRENSKTVTRVINVGADVVKHKNVYYYDIKTKSLAKKTLNVREIRSQKQLVDDINWLHMSGVLRQGQAADPEYYRFGDWVISFSLETFYVGVQFVGRIIDNSKNELPQAITKQLATNFAGLADATYKGMRKGDYRIFLAKEWMKGMNNNVINKNPTVKEACLTLAVFLSECCRNLRTYVVNMMGIDLIERGKLTTNEFLDNHPMTRGGAWHNQEENRPTVIPLEEKIVRLWMEDRTVIRSTEN